jgi:hypothetical protein
MIKSNGRKSRMVMEIKSQNNQNKIKNQCKFIVGALFNQIKYEYFNKND